MCSLKCWFLYNSPRISYLPYNHLSLIQRLWLLAKLNTAYFSFGYTCLFKLPSQGTFYRPLIFSSFSLQFNRAHYFRLCPSSLSSLLCTPCKLHRHVLYPILWSSSVKMQGSCECKVDLVPSDTEISGKQSLSPVFQTFSTILLWLVQSMLSYLSCKCITGDSDRRHPLPLIQLGDQSSSCGSLTNQHKLFLMNLHCL